MSVIPPTNNTNLIIDDFIRYATAHLTTVSGVITTVSLYPGIPLVPGPGVISWTGYNVQPASPSAPIGGVNTKEIEMNDAQLVVSEEASLEGDDISTATAKAFNEEITEPETEEQTQFYRNRREELDDEFEEDANSEPDPILPDDETPKDGIEPIPNYKTKLKVPNELVMAMRKYNICRTPLERAHFLAQTNHESGNFVFKEELASGDAYEGRRDLGNTQSGDGRRYKGRGYIQLTGRANYKRFGAVAGEDFESNPAIVGSKYYADTACMFWKSNRLGDKCKDSSLGTVKIVTKRINGGYNGLADRVKKFSKYWEELQKDPTLWS